MPQDNGDAPPPTEIVPALQRPTIDVDPGTAADDEPTLPAWRAPAPTSAPVPTDDRRTAPRLPLQVEIEFVTPHQFLNLYIYNISRGGLYVRIDDPPAVGTPVELRFELPLVDERIETTGTVVRCEQGERPGIGIAFERLSDHDRAVIDRLFALRKQMDSRQD
jgi:uncharacterized protein (TIGR02266 family)